MDEQTKYLMSLLEISACCYPIYVAVICELIESI